jgi:hypothetical protein
MGKLFNFFRRINDYIESENNKREEARAKYEFDSAVMDFEEKFEKTIERWNDKIDTAEDTYSDNPDDVVKAYNKAITICNEFKEFCYSQGPVGASYYDDNESRRIVELKTNLDNYMANDYESEKADFEEFKAEQKFFNDTKKKIYKIVSSSGDIQRTAVCSKFDVELKSLVVRASNALVDEGKIGEEKIKGRIWLKSIDK